MTEFLTCVLRLYKCQESGSSNCLSAEDCMQDQIGQSGLPIEDSNAEQEDQLQIQEQEYVEEVIGKETNLNLDLI